MRGNVKRPEVVVITGASAGVGRATVRKFANHDASIGLIARGRDGLDAAAREVQAAGGKALVLPVDVSHPDEVEAAAEQVEREFGPIDIWVNNAMTSVFSPIKQMTAEEFKRVTEVTYLGYVYGSLAALKRMLPRDRGVIVHVGPLSRTEASLFRPPTVLRSMPCSVSSPRCEPNSFTITAK
jgi:NAD(P)-dependent dehydrogenase (short-subunit alcohol dehydrogenase family)